MQFDARHQDKAHAYVQAGSPELETALKRYEDAVGLIDDFAPDRELATEALAEATSGAQAPAWAPILLEALLRSAAPGTRGRPEASSTSASPITTLTPKPPLFLMPDLPLRHSSP